MGNSRFRDRRKEAEVLRLMGAGKVHCFLLGHFFKTIMYFERYNYHPFLLQLFSCTDRKSTLDALLSGITSQRPISAAVSL